MFGNTKKTKTAKITTLIGQDTEVRGDVYFSGGLHIDGVIKGNVVATDENDAVLTLSENGSIEGEVRVPNMVLNGAVYGDVYAPERIELAIRARVRGNVYYNLIEMAIGAEVNGSLVHKDNMKPMLGYEADKGGVVEQADAEVEVVAEKSAAQ